MSEEMMRTVLFFCVLALAGCATPLQPNQTQLTFLSEPPGAMFYEGETAWGVAPQVRIYTSYNGTTKTNAVTAIWSSGARKTMTFNFTLGEKQIATFSRPPNAPGLNIDLAFAERLRQGDEASRAAGSAAIADVIRASQQKKDPVITNCINLRGGGVSCVTN
jgi:hypothetical protein